MTKMRRLYKGKPADKEPAFYQPFPSTGFLCCRRSVLQAPQRHKSMKKKGGGIGAGRVGGGREEEGCCPQLKMAMAEEILTTGNGGGGDSVGRWESLPTYHVMQKYVQVCCTKKIRQKGGVQLTAHPDTGLSFITEAIQLCALSPHPLLFPPTYPNCHI